jgi:O-antigen/teichoic acid export membrane protein
MVKRQFLRNVGYVMGGALAGQVANLLLTPAITRLFSPGNYGAMILFGSIAMLAGVVVCGCYERAVVLPKEDHEAWTVGVLGLLICSGVSVAVAALCVLFYQPLGVYLFGGKPSLWLLVMPVVVFLGGLRLLLEQWAIRKGAFRLLSTSKFAEASGNSGVKVAAGLLYGNSLGGLLLGVVGRSLFPAVILGARSLKTNLRAVVRVPSRVELSEVAARYKEFPLYASGSEFLNNFSRNLVVFCLAYVADSAAVGAFGLADNVLRVPVLLIGYSFRQVFLQWASKTVATGKRLASGFLRTSGTLAGLSAGPVLLVALGGQWLFGVVFGPEWKESGSYAQALSPWLFTVCVNPPSAVIYTVLERQKSYLKFFVFVTAARAFVFVVGWLGSWGPVTVIAVLSTVSAAINVGNMGLAYRMALQHDDRVRGQTVYDVGVPGGGGR